MKSRLIFNCLLAATLVLAGLTLWSTDAFAYDILPSQDTTIYEDFPNNSCGTGTGVFIGKNNRNVCSVSTGTFCNDNADCPAGETCDPPAVGAIRRGLLRFDIAGSVPTGSTIASVRLIMDSSRSGEGDDAPATLHRIQPAAGADWGEGATFCDDVRQGGQGVPADTGDATWIDRSFNNNAPWAAMGGDFDLFSATAIIPPTGQAIWDSDDPNNSAMVVDVQNWLDNPGMNYGWIVIGDEGRPSTTRRFDSREGRTPPILVVNIAGGVPCCDIDGEFLGICTEVPEGTCQTPPPDPNATSCEPNNPCPQPVGACCNQDESCSDLVTGEDCRASGGLFQGDGSACSDSQVDCGLEPFVEALPIPPILQPTSTRDDGVLQYTVSVEEASQSVHPDLSDTTVWTYNGAWPADTIVTVQDTPIEVTYINNLPTNGIDLLEVDTCAHGPNSWGNSKRIVTHLHGGHVPARVDGLPEYHILPGETDIYEYPNNQEAGTTWYHDHALGITRLNVYGGMAGFYLMSDTEDTLGPDNAFGLPSGQYEIGLAVQDRTFNPDGSLFYNASLETPFKGDKVVVNGKVWPYLNVDQGKYRFRILNGSQSREYSLRLENITNPGNDPSFTLVGTDLGLVSSPIDLGNTISIFAPAERMDVVIDFAGYPAGTEIIMRNDEQTPPRLFNIMKFVVTGNPGYTGAISSTLRPVPTMSGPDETRYFRLENLSNQLCKDASGRLVNEWVVHSLDGPGGNSIGKFWDDLTEFPVLGTREVWEFENPTNSMHPMHVHLVRFQIVSKETLGGQEIPLEPWEDTTWKDTVRVPPQSRVQVIMDFYDYPGRFPQHCHILDHEDHEMMRQFQTTWDPALAVVDGVCGPQEDCVSNPADCAEVSGALCGNGLCEAGDGENCVTCSEDCAGDQSGGGQFCCGFDDGQVTNPISCGVDANDDRCVNAADNLFCRVAERLRACCGDALCEGQETADNCAIDCPVVPPSCSDYNNRDDCNNDLNCMWEGGKNSGTCVDAPPVQCTRSDPSVTISPTAQDITTDGGSVLYTVSVTNNDTTACDATLFNLSVTDSDTGVNFVVPSNLDMNSVTLDPGASQNVNLTVTGQAGAENGAVNHTSATAADPASNHVNVISNSVLTTIDVGGQPVCEGITNRNECRNTTGCEWVGGRKSGFCQDATTCTPDEDPEVSCFDGADNDCNDATDCADTNCDGVVGPPTTCGVGECAGNTGELTCQNGTEVDTCDPFAGAVPEVCDDPGMLDEDCDGVANDNDPDCQPQDCSTYPDKDTCNADPNCKWRSQECTPR
jgi:spore coat protein A